MSKLSIWHAAVVGILLCAAPAAALAQSWVYWVDTGTGWIERAYLDGTNRQALIQADSPIGLALDPANGKMYWTEWNPGEIWSANLDGTRPAPVSVGNLTLVEPTDIEVAGGWLYWTDRMGSSINRAQINGNIVQTVYIWDAIMPLGLGVDAGDGLLFWTTTTDDLWRGTTTGGIAWVLPPAPLYGAADVVVDAANNRLYWAESTAGRISRANYFGGSWTVLFTANAILPSGLAVQPGNREVFYFSDVTSGCIYSAPALGQATLLVSGLTQPGDVELLLVNG